MPSLDKRLTSLEKVVIQHLTESGEIRQSIKTLAETVGKISDRMWYALWTLALGAIGIIGFLVKILLWK